MTNQAAERQQIGSYLHRTKLKVKTMKSVVRDPRFWVAMGVVIAIAATHDMIERLGQAANSPLDILPISFYWIPVMYMALTFGTIGATIVSASVVLATLPNWIVTEGAVSHWEEGIILFSAVAISILAGRQVDRKIQAQRSARDYAADAVRNQEEERRRLSHHLHDDSIQALISVCHEIDNMKDVPPALHQRLLGLRGSVAGIVERLRDVSVELRHPILDDFGIAAALRALTSDLSAKSGLKIEIDVEGRPRRLSTDAELAIFRITQEALRNVISHAGATLACVEITFSTKEITVEISDNGIGFDPSSFRDRANGNRHIGLLSMKERAEMLGGTITIMSARSKGTRVKALIPSDNKEDSRADQLSSMLF